MQGNQGRGGGIYHYDGSSNLESTIVAGNTAFFGPDFYGESGATPSAEYCLIGNNKDCNTFFPASAPGTNMIGTNPSPIDPKLWPLADNGGPTITHALLPGSPAIGTGDPDYIPPPEFDQRGEPFIRVYGGRIDIGAFEVHMSADFDSDSDIDGNDFLAWQRGFGTLAPNATKSDGDADNDAVNKELLDELFAEGELLELL